VYGMPRAAVERGFVTRVVALEALANTLQVQCMPEQARARAAAGDFSGGKV